MSMNIGNGMFYAQEPYSYNNLQTPDVESEDAGLTQKLTEGNLLCVEVFYTSKFDDVTEPVKPQCLNVGQTATFDPAGAVKFVKTSDCQFGEFTRKEVWVCPLTAATIAALVGPTKAFFNTPVLSIVTVFEATNHMAVYQKITK